MNTLNNLPRLREMKQYCAEITRVIVSLYQLSALRARQLLPLPPVGNEGTLQRKHYLIYNHGASVVAA